MDEADKFETEYAKKSTNMWSLMNVVRQKEEEQGELLLLWYW